MVTLRKKSEFSSDSIVNDLNTLIKFKKGQKQNAQSLPEVNLNLAMSATSALIKYLDVSIVIIYLEDFSEERYCDLSITLKFLLHFKKNISLFLIDKKINKGGYK